MFSLSLLSPFVLHAKYEIVVLGDSLSSGYKMDEKDGWVSLLDDSLKQCYENFEINNFSVSGDTTRNGLSKINIALENNPKLVILELGGNDGLRGLPLSSIKKNLKRIIETSLDKEVNVLLVGMRIPPNYGATYAEQFHKIYQDLAKAYSLPFINFLLEDVALHQKYMRSDGIHPNKEAQPLIAKHVWPTLMTMLPSEKIKNCSF